MEFVSPLSSGMLLFLKKHVLGLRFCVVCLLLLVFFSFCNIF